MESYQRIHDFWPESRKKMFLKKFDANNKVRKAMIELWNIYYVMFMGKVPERLKLWISFLLLF